MTTEPSAGAVLPIPSRAHVGDDDHDPLNTPEELMRVATTIQ